MSAAPVSQRSATNALQSVPAGIMHCPVAPFRSDGALDRDTYERLIEFHLSHGASSLCVGLHVAESLNLTFEERCGLHQWSVAMVAARVPVIAHASAASTDEAVALVRHAERAGANGVCVIAPYYWPLSEQALEAHFRAVLESVGIGVLLYNSPVFQPGTAIRPAMLIRLLNDYPHLVGLKEASHSFETFIELRRAARSVRNNFGLIAGVEYVLPALALGGVGSMSVFSSIAPRLVADLYAAVRAADLESARALQERASHLWQLMKPDYPAPIKSGMALLGRPVGGVRGPMQNLSAERLAALEEALAQMGILEDEPHGW